ncbi:MAG: 2-hydroxyacyl-CoA dehydratase family protein [Thermoleophilia bacterium]|nr:2-hydroxyacyl-CoA dehydratase family protein [Thermoleophilia bacterium]
MKRYQATEKSTPGERIARARAERQPIDQPGEIVDGGWFWRRLRNKYAARVERIATNPKRGMLRSNLLLYQAMLEYVEEELQAWEELGDDIPIWSPGAALGYRLGPAMGFHTYPLDSFTDLMTPDEARWSMDYARKRGFPSDICDRIQNIGTLMVSGRLPQISLVTLEFNDCSQGAQANLWAGREVGSKIYTFDVPFEQDMEAVRYVEEQLREMIDIAVKNIPGVKYDRESEERLIEYQRTYREAMHWQRKIAELAAQKPCPISGRDALRMPARQLCWKPSFVEYFKESYEELSERAGTGEGPLTGPERFRVLWTATAPFYTDPFGYLEERGCAVPVYEEGTACATYYVPGEGEQYFGQELENPIQEEAATLLSDHWAGTAERRIWEVTMRCRQLGIDGIVHFEQGGCVTCNGSARVMGERIESELDIPSLYIRGWCQDLEKHDEQAFEAQLGEWLEICTRRKEARRQA